MRLQQCQQFRGSLPILATSGRPGVLTLNQRAVGSSPTAPTKLLMISETCRSDTRSRVCSLQNVCITRQAHGGTPSDEAIGEPVGHRREKKNISGPRAVCTAGCCASAHCSSRGQLPRLATAAYYEAQSQTSCRHDRHAALNRRAPASHSNLCSTRRPIGLIESVRIQSLMGSRMPFPRPPVASIGSLRAALQFQYS